MNFESYARLRQELHQNPELSGKEEHTAQRITQILQTLSPFSIHTHIGGNSVIGEYCFPESGPTLLFRADTDAIALQENQILPYHSQHPGAAHKCGHDGHTAILLAFAELLHHHPLQRGRIFLLFQPAEETGKGAKAVLESPFFQQNKIEQVFALHNLPGYPHAAIICRPGSFTCSVISCSIRIQGKTAHAAEPEKAISPTPILLEILRKTENWNSADLSSEQYFRSTLIELHIGEEAYVLQQEMVSFVLPSGPLQNRTSATIFTIWKPT